MNKTPGQLATEKARAASIRSKKQAAARRHAQKWIEGLELIGYTVTMHRHRINTGDPNTCVDCGEHLENDETPESR